MSITSVRYQFHDEVNFEDVEGALVVAVLAIESLYGPAAVRVNAGYSANPVTRRCVIDASTNIGQALNQLFVGFLSRDLGPATFTVERVRDVPLSLGVATA